MIEFGNINIYGDLPPVDVDSGEWNSRRYERAVQENLERIEQTRVGRILLKHVIAPIVLFPFSHLHEGPNAWSTPGAGPGHASPPDNRSIPRVGVGSPATAISYTPDLFQDPDAADGQASRGIYPARSDSVLFHELFHSVEAQWGTLRHERVGRSAYDISRIAEHRAVRVTNMYRSELNRALRGPYGDTAYMSASGYRFSHHGLQYNQGAYGYRGVRRVARNPASTRHDQFVQFEHRLIGEFILDFPSITEALEQVPGGVCEYNPFREFWNGRYDTVLLPAYWAPPRDPRPMPTWIRHTG